MYNCDDFHYIGDRGWFMSVKLNLGEIDFYHCEPLNELKKGCLQSGEKFFVCSIHEGDKNFLCEASSFFDHYFKALNDQESPLTLENPLTRHPLTSFTIYKYDPTTELFDQVFGQDDVSEEKCALIMAQDPKRSETERGELYYRSAVKAAEIDENEVLDRYRCAAQFGCLAAQVKVLESLEKKGLSKECRDYLHWSLMVWKNAEPFDSLQDCYRCMRAFELNLQVENHQQYAFLFCQRGALQGNPYMIAKMVRYYELGYGVDQSLEKAALWRDFLPEQWKNRPIREYMQHACQDPTLLTQKIESFSPPETVEIIEGCCLSAKNLLSVTNSL